MSPTTFDIDDTDIVVDDDHADVTNYRETDESRTHLLRRRNALRLPGFSRSTAVEKLDRDQRETVSSR